MRLDKYLKVSRLIKRRTVANEACDAGRVNVNGKVAKASQEVKVGDVISIREHVVGVTSDPNLYDIDNYSSWTESAPLTVGGETAEFTASFDPYYWENMTAEKLATY